jgi:asparagine synthase (glutamine-hydrolysing)
MRRMTASLSHRGPDADGFFVAGNVALGHRRLTVIDTSDAANQPFFNAAGNVVVVFNGEIYNFRRLRRRLEERGHTFRTRSDTEVMVAAWEEYGAGMLAYLRGMFALALFDSRSGELFLARDRLGKKPLFYSASPEKLLFGSEIKALLEDPGLDRGLCEQTVRDYACYGYSVADRTIFRHVAKLPPGHFLSLDTRAATLEPRIERYWDCLGETDPRPTEAEWLDELDETLSEAVRLRMIADVPLGAFLSGGIDSSLIVAYMTKHAGGERVKTFAIGFRDPAFDESGYARAVAEHLGTEHRNEIVEPDAVAVLPALVKAYDEPFADTSAIPTYYLSRMTREHVTVAVSGDGGDELFYGYQHHRQSLILDRLARAMTPPGRAAAAGLARAFSPGSFFQRAFSRLGHVGFDLYHHAMGYSDDYLSLLRPEVRRRQPDGGPPSAAAAFRRGGEHGLLQRYQDMDLNFYLPDDILVKVDRASMAHALEVRAPLLDHRVVELAVRIPPSLQMGFRVQKLLLRRLAYKYVPRELVDRPKRGFGAPLGAWFRNELRPLFQEVLDDTTSPMWEYFDPATARRRFDDHLARRSDSGQTLWRLLFFHRWSRDVLG